jgi:hypothetical protein
MVDCEDGSWVEVGTETKKHGNLYTLHMNLKLKVLNSSNNSNK